MKESKDLEYEEGIDGLEEEKYRREEVRLEWETKLLGVMFERKASFQFFIKFYIAMLALIGEMTI